MDTVNAVSNPFLPLLWASKFGASNGSFAWPNNQPSSPLQANKASPADMPAAQHVSPTGGDTATFQQTVVPNGKTSHTGQVDGARDKVTSSPGKPQFCSFSFRSLVP